ncbi:MAG: AmmeMemoRadiSam system protein A [Isosphaeraceae bacterium]
MLPIDQAQKRYALDVARRNLLSFLERGELVGHESASPGLLQRRATFVTLRRRDTGDLRGCRGECRPSRPLIESLIAQAINAATDDPRFPSVTLEEIAVITLRISVLTTPRPIRPDQIVLGRHGLIAIQESRSGLLLPEVPGHFGLKSAREFLAAVLRKAGLSETRPERGEIELYGFETIAWGDEDLD